MRTGDGSIVEFRSVVDAVNCAIEVQRAMVERDELPEDRRIVFRIGIHLGDVVEESDGDLMGDGVNIAARLEGIAKPGAICRRTPIGRSRVGLIAASAYSATQLNNIAEPIQVYSLEVGQPAQARPSGPKRRSALTLLAAGSSSARRCVWDGTKAEPPPSISSRAGSARRR